MGDSWGDRAFSIVFHSPVKKKPLEQGRVIVRESDFIEERESNRNKTESLFSDNLWRLPEKTMVGDHAAFVELLLTFF